MGVLAVPFSTLLEASGVVYVNFTRPNPDHVGPAFWYHWAQDRSSVVLTFRSASKTHQPMRLYCTLDMLDPLSFMTHLSNGIW